MGMASCCTPFLIWQARAELRRVHKRELHTFVGEKLLPPGGGKRGTDRGAGVLRFLVAAAAAEAAAEAENGEPGAPRSRPS
jgi:hypothetical protein